MLNCFTKTVWDPTKIGSDLKWGPQLESNKGRYDYKYCTMKAKLFH